MEKIRKIPFILGIFMALLIGFISELMSVTKQEIYIRMAMGLVVFFVIGLFARNVFIKIIEELEEKKRLEDIETKRLEDEEKSKKRKKKKRYEDEKEEGRLVGNNLDLETDDNFKIDDISGAVSNQLDE